MTKFAIILCGGIGERLWPVSTEDLPKQFHSIISDKSLLDQTIERLPKEYTIILVSNIRYKSYLEYTYPNYLTIYEPLFKSNAISILLAVKYIKQNYGLNNEAIVLPSDHYFDNEYFNIMIDQAFNNLKGISIFGIRPTYPEIGYGYINHKNGLLINFIEKPTKEKASELIEENCLWNVGIFMFRIDTIIELYKKFQPTMYDIALSLDIRNINVQLFEKLENISFDYAIMEKLCEININYANVIEYNGIWNDVGDWNRISNTDVTNNISTKNVLEIDCSNCYFKSDKYPILAIGLKNIIAVNYNENILLCERDSLYKLKSALPLVKSKEVKYRPWGFYKDIYKSATERIKKISVYPGKRLSLQYHNHRTENWTITKGVGKIQLDQNVFYKKETESVFIPVKAIHRIENDTKELIEFIEVQLGTYLEEDDIIRLEDDYGRF